MPVPDQIPQIYKEPTSEMRRAHALEKLSYELYLAVERLNRFLAVTDTHEAIIRRIHTAKTNVVDTDGNSHLESYFTIWTDVADFRLTQDGRLLRSDYENISDKFAEARAGADKSVEISLDDISRQYKTIQIQSLSTALSKILSTAGDRTEN